LVNRANQDAATVRWAGAGLAVSGITLLGTITVYGAVFSSIAATDPDVGVTVADKADHLIRNWGTLTALWVAEVTAYVLMAVSALVLVSESEGGVRWLPRRAAWAAIAVGAILQTAMYAFMLGGYQAAVEVADSMPALLQTFNDAAHFLFNASNAAILIGFGGAYASEAGSEVILSRRLGWIGSSVCFAGFVLLLAVAAQIISLVAVIPFALGAHVLMAYLGVRLYRTAKSAAVEVS
jgi:hypothetical protein